MESKPMNGGDGTYSYLKNSNYQRASSSLAMRMVGQVIADKFDVTSLTSSSNTIVVADLGCSTGPNTFFTTKDLLDSIERRCSSQGLACQDLDFQVFFNDLPSNDFNTLFTSLPIHSHSHRQYYAAGVPGSFYDQLFPKSSLHFVCCLFSLHWLTKIPKELVDENSTAWNKGRIHYGSASDDVANAYAAQFYKGIEMFLNARAKEIKVGGMMALTMVSLPDGVHRSVFPMNAMVDFLGSNLMDMVDLGLITEAQVDSFNLPLYFPNLEEMREIVEKNGCYSIALMKILDPNLEILAKISPDGGLSHIRAVTEGVLTNHFGEEVVKELFERVIQKIAKIPRAMMESSYKKGNELLIVLQRT